MKNVQKYVETCKRTFKTLKNGAKVFLETDDVKKRACKNKKANKQTKENSVTTKKGLVANCMNTNTASSQTFPAELSNVSN